MGIKTQAKTITDIGTGDIGTGDIGTGIGELMMNTHELPKELKEAKRLLLHFYDTATALTIMLSIPFLAGF
jgi:hypothetical protein